MFCLFPYYILILYLQSLRRSDVSNFVSTSAPWKTLCKNFWPSQHSRSRCDDAHQVWISPWELHQDQYLPVFRTESQCVPSHGLLVPFAYEAVEIVCYPPQWTLLLVSSVGHLKTSINSLSPSRRRAYVINFIHTCLTLPSILAVQQYPCSL